MSSRKTLQENKMRFARVRLRSVTKDWKRLQIEPEEGDSGKDALNDSTVQGVQNGV
jgi:hypothetical protein